ncbi:MAG: hypothetical protein HYS39_00695 [Proteobacteria bacterium]|nr:hypothetical protein [Pseudomonadota bacterium]
MADFGLMKEVLQYLNKQDDLQKTSQEGLGVYLSLPPNPIFPCVCLEVEEIWSNLRLSGRRIVGKVKFKLSCMTKGHGQQLLQTLSQKVSNCLEGKVLSLLGKRKAILRLHGMVHETPAEITHRRVHHYYEALIREEIENDV